MNDIPSGKNTHDSQADGAPASAAPVAAVEGAAPATAPVVSPRFVVSVEWSGDESGCGTARVAGETLAIPIGGAKELGGCGRGANPEELLLAAVGACFAATWGIFLRKLGVDHPDPTLRLTSELGKDPKGGFRMTRLTIYARVPGALLASKRTAVEKTLALAEKYCIISKVAKAAMPLDVVMEEMQ